MLRLLVSSDLSEQSLQLVALRQACSESRVSDATRIFGRFKNSYPNDHSMMWLSHMIMNQTERAHELLLELDEADDLNSLADFLSYAQFDSRYFPNLMAFLESQGVEPREPLQVLQDLTRHQHVPRKLR
jgi:hypothetical protein